MSKLQKDDTTKNLNSLVSFESASGSQNMELNSRLTHFEKSISDLDNKLVNSHNTFRQSISDLTKKSEFHASFSALAQKQLRNLDSSYKSLITQSEILNKKSISLGQLLEKSHRKQSDSFQFMDNKLIESSNLFNQEVSKIKEDLSTLFSEHKKVDTQFTLFLENINKLNQSLKETEQAQGKQVKALERKVDLKVTYLENQVKQNLTNQNNEIESINRIILKHEEKLNKELLDIPRQLNQIAKEHTEQLEKLDTKFNLSNGKLNQIVVNSEKQLNSKIDTNQETSTSNLEQSKQQLSANLEISKKELSANLEQSRQEFSANLEQSKYDLTISLDQTREQLSTNLEESIKGLEQFHKSTITKLKDTQASVNQQFKNDIDSHHKDSSNHFSNIEQQHKEVDIKLLKLDKSALKMDSRADGFDDELVQINKITDGLIVEKKDIKALLSKHIKLEKFHFNSLSMALSIVIIFILFSTFFARQSIIDTHKEINVQQKSQTIAISNQQTLNQKLKTDFNKQHLTNEQLKSKLEKQEKLVNQQKESLSQKATIQQKLTTQVSQLNGNLEKQAKENNIYKQKLKDQQEKLVMVDEQLQYMNHSVGPLSDYQYGGLESSQWIKSQKMENHSIQLKGFKNKHDLLAFIEAEGYYLKQPLAYYPLNKQGVVEYVLLYGSFDKIKQAEVAMYDLPYAISSESNGIVTMKDVQANLDK